MVQPSRSNIKYTYYTSNKGFFSSPFLRESSKEAGQLIQYPLNQKRLNGTPFIMFRDNCGSNIDLSNTTTINNVREAEIGCNVK